MFNMSSITKMLMLGALGVSLAGPVDAQNVGDVGKDKDGNVFTYGYDENGNRTWIPGRHGNIVKERTIVAERYIPTIWTDPDGCEHWVMDDGVEGFMTPHVTPDGTPVCRRGNTCGVVSSDQLFHTDSHRISASGRAALEEFFKSSTATAFAIEGHTDHRASDEYNMKLSKNRARAVANVANSVGVRVARVSWYGERKPVATNSTHAGMAKNRRVEIICYK